MSGTLSSQTSAVVKRGSSLSTRQIEQAAVRGRRVGFKFFSAQPAHEVLGYVVGMDDYHWMLATRTEGEGGVVTPVLIHKQADAVVLHPDETLSTEPDAFRTQVEAIGKSYWDRLKSQNKEETGNNGNA